MATDQRVAIVIGAARGIGAGIAERLLRDGYRVALWDIRADVEGQAGRLAGAGREVLAATIDVTDADQVQARRHEVIARWGRIDVLVNNAGGDSIGMFLESTPERWQRIIALNYVAVLNTCRWIGPDIVKAGSRSRIIQIASDTAKIGGPGQAVYSGAKGAVVSFSRALARELAPTGVTVNVICPGSTDIPALREIADQANADAQLTRFFGGNLLEEQAHKIPLGRLGQPSDIAQAM